MLIKIPNMDDQILEQLKAATCRNTGSRAVESAAIGYLELRATVAKQHHENKRLMQRLEAAEATIQRARAAASELLERTAELI
ncbi:hypothetical protein [Pseudomonas sp. BN607]|uniref:hypothetical protein n=1 Tax=Pseudomonas sp. BN607 TaxID=2567895 RepID=UPI002457A7DE|nr:hypothetical protein [Pseudomonas sp. BN607]MDH4550362.1 hypothetical protein [Pseudomonas sp. BN607]MDH4550798.1 hypothetical protein [Pseudomonas sp. BN607]